MAVGREAEGEAGEEERRTGGASVEEQHWRKSAAWEEREGTGGEGEAVRGEAVARDGASEEPGGKEKGSRLDGSGPSDDDWRSSRGPPHSTRSRPPSKRFDSPRFPDDIDGAGGGPSV